MDPALISLAVQVGAPLIRDVLTKKIGAGNAQLATDVLDLVAHHAGVDVADLERKAQTNPDLVKDAILNAEADVPGIVALYTAGLEGQFALLKAEAKGPLWTWAWRPMGMYVIGFLWMWNVVLLHVANAIWKIALPPADFSVLMQISGLYMALYMGGHTFKDFVSTKWGQK